MTSVVYTQAAPHVVARSIVGAMACPRPVAERGQAIIPVPQTGFPNYGQRGSLRVA